VSASRSRDSVEAMLRNKLEAILDSSKDHRFYELYAEGQWVFRTKVSTGGKYRSLGDDLIAKMAKQCFVNNKQFIDLVDCPMSKAQWVAHLKANGHIV